MSKVKHHSQPNPAPTDPMAVRLEDIRQERMYKDLSSFWRALGGKESGTSYASVRRYHFDREASPAYLARVIETFPVYRAEWLLTGKGPKKHGEEDVRRKAADPMFAMFAEKFDEVHGELAWWTLDATSRSQVERLWQATLALRGLFGRDDAEDADRCAADVAHALKAPLDALRIAPGKPAMSSYVILMTEALLHVTTHPYTHPNEEENSGDS